MPYKLFKNKVCSKCGVVGGLFYSRKRKDRPLKINQHRICQRCKREEVQDSYFRWSEGKVKRRYNLNSQNMYLTETV